jgi:hypothetical protein
VVAYDFDGTISSFWFFDKLFFYLFDRRWSIFRQKFCKVKYFPEEKNIIVVTCRPAEDTEMLMKWLKKNNISFKKVICVGVTKDILKGSLYKAIEIHKYKATRYISDLKEEIEYVAEILNYKIVERKDFLFECRKHGN